MTKKEEWILALKCVFFRWTKLYKCPYCDKDNLQQGVIKR